MKTKILFLVSLAIASAATAKDDLPKALSFTRYQKMLKRSPFAVATAAAPVATTPNFARDLFIANAAHSEEGDLVTLASTTDNNFKLYLSSKDPVDGYSISNIQWSERVGETKVTIAKEGQFATLTFNQALISQESPGAPGAPGLQLPPQPLNNPAQITGAVPDSGPRNMQRIQPAPIPRLPTPPPHVRGVIPRNPNTFRKRPRPQGR